MAAPLTVTANTIEPATPVELFRALPYEGAFAPDATGRQFLIAKRSAATETVPLHLLVNPFQQP